MKKIVSALIVLLPFVSTYAYDLEYQGLFYDIDFNSKTMTVVNPFYNPNYDRPYYGYCSGRITIPSSIKFGDNDYTVTAIGESAFNNCSDLTAIVIPNSITKIGRGAFSSCTSLTLVNIPESISEIDNSAFYYCESIDTLIWDNDNILFSIRLFEWLPNLKHVTIGKIRTDFAPFEECDSLRSAAILDGTTTIPEGMFLNCSSLKSITIPESVTSIGAWAFSDCYGLESVIIPNGVTHIGTAAFRGCWNLTSINIPNGVKTIESTAFGYCSGLTEISIPKSVTSVDGAFIGCSNLKKITVDSKNESYDSRDNCNAIIKTDSGTLIQGCSNTVIPNSVTAIGSEAFYDCTSLTSMAIPNSVTTIGDWAFYNCSSLTSVTIPNSVTTIGGWAFYNCSNLTSVTIPNSVTTIGNSVFWGCSNLTSIEIPKSVTTIGLSILGECPNIISIQVDPANTVYDSRNNCNAIIETATNTLILGCKNTIIPESVTDIRDYALPEDWETDKPDGPLYAGNVLFSYVGEMPENTTIVVKDGTKRIASSAFAGCTGLTSIVIPESVTSIGYEAFSGCSLKSITIPSGIEAIEVSTFRDCSALTSITIPGSVKEIGITAFENCTRLTSVFIQDGVTSIAQGAFDGCKSISTVSIPKSITNIDQQAFDYWDCSIDTLFWNCPNVSISQLKRLYRDSLKFVSIGADVTGIEGAAFASCSILDSVYISKGVTSIEDGAFQYCRKLKSVTIPGSVTSIGNNAFAQCGLTSISIPESVTSIGYGVFSGCPLPNGVLYINDILYDYIGIMPDSTTIVVKDGTKRIADGAFSDCRGLTSITIPESVTSIGDGAFANCSGLKSVVISNGVQIIGDKAFYDCYYLRSISIPESVTSIGERALDFRFDTLYWNSIDVYPDELIIGDNYYNTNKVIVFGDNYVKHRGLGYAQRDSEWYKNLPDGPVYLYNWLVGYKGAIPANTQIEIKEGTVGIAANAFMPTEYNEDDGLITSVTIPESVTTIEGGAFTGCGISSIFIPKSVTSIGETSFSSCSYLTTIIVDPENSVFDSRDNCNAIIETASNTLFQGCSNTIIPASVTTIGEYAFQASNLTSITIPEGVTYISSNAFSLCEELETIILPEGLQAIGDKAFFNCKKLQSIVIPKSVTSFGWGVFLFCTSLSSISIDWPDEITSIPADMFDECHNLTSINIPESVTSIESFAFRNCYNLIDINIPKSVKTIGQRAFYGCSGLTKIPDGLTYIGDEAFSYCHNITSVSIPEDITYVGYRAFEGCTGIKSISFPESMGGFETDDLWGLFRVDSSNVESISFHSSNPIRYYGSYNNDFDKCTLYVPAGSKEAYRNRSPWSKFKNIRLLDDCGLYIDGICYEITSDVDKTVSVVHRNYQGSIKIPSTVMIDGTEYTVTGIAQYAFSECNELTSVTIPPSVTEIEQESFTECNTLNDIIFEGSTIINKNVFVDCPNIERIVSKSMVPGIIHLNNPFIAGDCETVIKDHKSKFASVRANYREGVNRFVSSISPFTTSDRITISSDNIPAGKYRISIGIVPSPDSLLNRIHPIVNAYIGENKIVLLDSIAIEIVSFDGWDFPMEMPYYLVNGTIVYDTIIDQRGRKKVVKNILKPIVYESLVISESLRIPEGCTKLELVLQSGVTLGDYELYSTNICIDRVSIEPLDNIAPESYCGPFTESVFNNATLYVQEEAVDTYRNTPGWSLFKNIAIDTSVDPIRMGTAKGTGNSTIHDVIGRKVMTQDFDELQPGLYIIDGKKYLKR